MLSINQMTHDWARQRNLPSYFIEETESTNDWAKRDFHGRGHMHALYLTDHQSKGRGRYERRWENGNPGHTLLASFCLKAKTSLQPIFTPLVGLATYKALKSAWPLADFALKAPNDIYLNNGKLAGLLVEAAVHGTDDFEIIIGLGLNAYSAPPVDLPTEHLSAAVDLSSDSWFAFLDYYWPLLNESLDLGANKNLQEQQIKELEAAMNHYKPTRVEKVFPDGSLQIDGKINHWRDM